jgi:DNA replication protein DnaC
MSLSWLKDGRPLVLIGQTGVGKTYLAQAAGLKACQEGKTVLFLSMTRWLEEQTQAREMGGSLKFRDKITRSDLLILDDFGMRKLSAIEAEDFREMLEERSYGKSTLVTTQLPFDHWSEVIPDPVLSEAIVDRLEQPALIYKITGESYRKTKAQKLAAEERKQ